MDELTKEYDQLRFQLTNLLLQIEQVILECNRGGMIEYVEDAEGNKAGIRRFRDAEDKGCKRFRVYFEGADEPGFYRTIGHMSVPRKLKFLALLPALVKHLRDRTDQQISELSAALDLLRKMQPRIEQELGRLRRRFDPSGSPGGGGSTGEGGGSAGDTDGGAER